MECNDAVGAVRSEYQVNTYKRVGPELCDVNMCSMAFNTR